MGKESRGSKREKATRKSNDVNTLTHSGMRALRIIM